MRYGRRLARILLGAAMLAAGDARAQMIHGRLWAADGGSTAGLRVTVYAGAWADSAAVDSAGRFRVRRPASLAGDSVRVVVDAPERVFHPSVAAVPRAEWDEEARIVLVPRRWAIASGTHAGDTVPVSMVRAFEPACRGCASGFYGRAGARSGARAGAVPAWRPGSFPLRVAFDHEYTTETITRRDSAAFWRDVGELERDLGMHLFRPARFADTAPVDEGPDDVVLVWVESGMRAAGLGSVTYTGSNINYGAVRIHAARSFTEPAAPGLVAHEMVHTLGVGHTCTWHSVMADVTRCPRQRASAPTAEDVAYVQLHLAMGSLQRAHRARWGFDAALRGEVELARLPAPNVRIARPTAP
jgi:hypothetical protein